MRISLDTVLGLASLAMAGLDAWLKRRGVIKRSWWAFWLLLAFGFALFSVWRPTPLPALLAGQPASRSAADQRH